MNKAQLIEALAVRLDGNKRTANEAVEGVLDIIYGEVSRGNKVQITGFGVFEKRDRAARLARNPATGAPVRVKKTSVPAFRAGAEFKAITSGAKKVAKAPAKKAAAKKTAAKKAAPATKAAAKKTAAKKTVAKKAAKKAAKNAR